MAPVLIATAVNSERSSRSDEQAAPLQPRLERPSQWKILCICAAAGALLGLSSPGIEQSYLAWCGLAPLLLAVSASSTKRQAFARAFAFGLAYNLVYIHWVLFTQAQAFAWTGMASYLPQMMAVLSWLIFSGQQAVVIGVFGALARAIPTSTTLWPVRLGGRWHWPTFITVPLLWFLVVNKIGNGSWILGIPWSMLEYSQYKQLPLLSLCPYIGGIGLEVILVGVNVLFACAVVSYFNWSGRPRVSYRARPGMIFSMATTASILALALAVTTGKGAISGSQDSCETSPAKAPAKTITVSVIQGNVGLDPVSPRKIVSDQVKLTSTAPKGLCVWTEWSVPCYLSSRPDVYQKLACEAKKNEQDWLVGTMDKSTTGEVYNAVCALSKAGDVIKPAYYKRFLVPFGEYIPDFFKNSPLNALLSGSDDENFQPGKEATIINLQQVKVAPLVCFESIKPELVTESVRAGGEIIADLSDIKWFGTCILRDQLLAACVMRAAECNRSFVFASNTGPSALIAPNGKIKRMGPADCAAVIVDQLPLQDRLTPFCRWYR